MKFKEQYFNILSAFVAELNTSSDEGITKWNDLWRGGNTFHDDSTLYAAVKIWVASIKRRNFFIQDEESSGRSISVSTSYQISLQFMIWYYYRPSNWTEMCSRYILQIVHVNMWRKRCLQFAFSLYPTTTYIDYIDKRKTITAEYYFNQHY